MKNSPFKFHYNSFQSFFTFVHFSPLNFKFIQLWPLHQLQLNFFFFKILENIFQSLIGYIFKFKRFEVKN